MFPSTGATGGHEHRATTKWYDRRSELPELDTAGREHRQTVDNRKRCEYHPLDLLLSWEETRASTRWEISVRISMIAQLFRRRRVRLPTSPGNATAPTAPNGWMGLEPPTIQASLHAIERASGDLRQALTQFAVLLVRSYGAVFGVVVKEDVVSRGRTVRTTISASDSGVEVTRPGPMVTKALLDLSYHVRAGGEPSIIRVADVEIPQAVTDFVRTLSQKSSVVSLKVESAGNYFVELYFPPEQWQYVQAWINFGVVLVWHFQQLVAKGTPSQPALPLVVAVRSLHELTAKAMSEPISATDAASVDMLTGFLSFLQAIGNADAVVVLDQQAPDLVKVIFSQSIAPELSALAASRLKSFECHPATNLSPDASLIRLPERLLFDTKGEPLRSGFVVPSESGHSSKIVVVLLSRLGKYPQPFDGERLLLSCIYLASLLRISEQLETLRGDVQSLAHFVNRLAGGASVEEILTVCFDEAQRRFPGDLITILLSEGNYLTVSQARGEGAEQVIGFRFPIDQGLCGKCVRGRSVVNVPDVTKAGGEYVEGYPGIRSELAVPILGGDGQEVLGVLDIESKALGRYSKYDEEIAIRIASQTAAALKRAELRTQITDLYDRLNTQSRLVALGDMASGIGHVAGNLLGDLDSALQVIDHTIGELHEAESLRLTKSQYETLEEKLNESKSAFSSLSDLMHRQKVFARPIGGKKEEVDLANVLGDLMKVLNLRAEKRRIRIRSSVSPGLKSDVDPTHMQFCLWNLINNAIDANATVIKILSERYNDETGRPWFRIVVDDNGEGVPEGIKPKLFQRFVTSKPPEKGTGLGLYSSRKLIQEENGGRVGFLLSEPKKTTRFYLDLPVSESKSR